MQDILVNALCSIESGPLRHLSDPVHRPERRRTPAIHPIHPKLDEITDGIPGEVVAADVNIAIDRCAECDRSERTSMIGCPTTGIHVHDSGCDAPDHVSRRQERRAQVGSRQVAEMQRSKLGRRAEQSLELLTVSFNV